MDLSQQELPLTAYFLRGSKDARSCTSSHKRKKEEEEERPAEDLPSVARSSKSAARSKSRATTLQLPTPATSSRKRKRTGHSEVPAKPQAASTGVAEYNALSQNEEDPLQLEFGATPSKLPHRSRDAIPCLDTVPLATPSTDQRRTTRVPGLRHTDREETAIERFPLAHSKCQLPSASTPTSSGLPGSTGSIASHLAVNLNSPDPFYERKKDNDLVQRDSAPPKQCFSRPKTADGQPPDGHVVPMIPVSSSQSQYLLHIDATPKRKRGSRHVETVISSQTQEERELTLLPRKLAALDHSLVGASPEKRAPTPGLRCNKQKGQLQLGSTCVGQPIHSPSGYSRASMAVKAMGGLLTNLSSPSRCESPSHHSPSRKAKTPRRPPRHRSIENIPPTCTDDSLTESESESDILRMKMKCKVSTLGSPSREKSQISGLLCTRDACLPLAGDNLAGAEDDSVTEAESDTEILRCVAEIGRKRLRDPPQVARENGLPPPVISPLVSPTRPRIATKPLITGSIQFRTQEGVGSSIPESCAPLLSREERPQLPSESLPSVVRDFICMFSGDESYPADFPESLRV